ncbi:hypothetical protein CBR_g28710 [Chara braunii]|uniref:Uncharacterized protein n=1 Tax=Chara braunii TaxID=69332 RepID=A0A388L9K5_CHABU|nr:hypothetical protein CBR_g28710 [Chara braunii]|eukprot:GBG78997.1 hypothetical protein CBR_g28710 [Chara braunii]
MDPILASNVEEERRDWREIEQRYDAVVLKELQAAHWRLGGPEVAKGYCRRQDSKPRGRHTRPPRGTGGGRHRDPPVEVHDRMEIDPPVWLFGDTHRKRKECQEDTTKGAGVEGDKGTPPVAQERRVHPPGMGREEEGAAKHTSVTPPEERGRWAGVVKEKVNSEVECRREGKACVPELDREWGRGETSGGRADEAQSPSPPSEEEAGKVEILEGKGEDSQGRLDGQALRSSGGETGQTKEVLSELGGERKQKGQVGLDEISPGKVSEDINEANGWSNDVEVVESSGRLDEGGGGGNRKESTPGGKVGESEVLPGGGQAWGEDKQVMLDCVRASTLDRKVGEEETAGGNSKERTPGGKVRESEALQGGGQKRGRTGESGGKEEVGGGGRGEKDGSGDGSGSGEPPLGQQQECWLLVPYGRTETGAESTNVHIPVPGGAKEGESDDVEVVDLAASLSALSPPPPSPPPSHKSEPTTVTSDSGSVGMPRRRRKQLTSGPPISSPAEVGSSLQQATGAIQSDREEERCELQARVDAKLKSRDRSRSPAGRKVQPLKDEDRWVSPQRRRIEEEELQNKVAEEGLAKGMEDVQPRQPAPDLDEPMTGDGGGDSTDDRGGAMDEDMDINEGMEADMDIHTTVKGSLQEILAAGECYVFPVMLWWAEQGIKVVTKGSTEFFVYAARSLPKNPNITRQVSRWVDPNYRVKVLPKVSVGRFFRQLRGGTEYGLLVCFTSITPRRAGSLTLAHKDATWTKMDQVFGPRASPTDYRIVNEFTAGILAKVNSMLPTNQRLGSGNGG